MIKQNVGINKLIKIKSPLSEVLPNVVFLLSNFMFQYNQGLKKCMEIGVCLLEFASMDVEFKANKQQINAHVIFRSVPDTKHFIKS